MTPTQRAIVVACWAVMTCAWCAVMSGQHEVVVYGAGVVSGRGAEVAQAAKRA